MLDLIKLIRNELLADNTITALVKQRIYMEFSPHGNTSAAFPQITISADEGSTDSLTNDYFPDLRIHVWTKGEEKVTEAKKIAKRILINIDKKSYLSNDPCVFQLWKSFSATDFEDETQIYHKVLTFDVVMEGYSD